MMPEVDERRARVLELKAQGLSYRQIEHETGVNRGTISRWIERDYAQWRAARAVLERMGDLDDELAEHETLAAILADDDGATDEVLAHARAVITTRTICVLQSIVESPETSLRDRLRASDRLLAWTHNAEPADEPPALPLLPPSRPSETHDEECAERCTGLCAAGRWSAWSERVLWARAQPMATDRSAVAAGGKMVTEKQVAGWLKLGAEHLGDENLTPAARFAARFAAAAGDSTAKLLQAYGRALEHGDSRTAGEVRSALQAMMPDEYDANTPPAQLQGMVEDPVARILRQVFERGRA